VAFNGFTEGASSLHRVDQFDLQSAHSWLGLVRLRPTQGHDQWCSHLQALRQGVCKTKHPAWIGCAALPDTIQQVMGRPHTARIVPLESKNFNLISSGIGAAICRMSAAVDVPEE
jgi:hypothetical protein